MSQKPPLPASDIPDGVWADLVNTLTIVLEHRRPVVISALVGFAAFIAITLVQPLQYESHISFVPAATDQTLGLLGGVAAQLGIGNSEANIGSPDYYADLAKSTGVIATIATDSVRQSSSSTLVGVSDLLGVPRDGDQQRRQRTVEELRRRVKAEVSPTSGIVTISISTADPVASKQIIGAVYSHLAAEDRRTRNAQAAAEHRYAKSQVDASRIRLMAVEDSLQLFLTANREFRNSPKLAFQYDRLQRAVDLQQQLFTSLSQTEQSAALDEVRNTPTLSILDSAGVSALPLSRHLGIKSIAGLLIGSLLAVFAILLTERARLATGSDSSNRLFAAARATVLDLSSLARRFRRKDHV